MYMIAVLQLNLIEGLGIVDLLIRCNKPSFGIINVAPSLYASEPVVQIARGSTCPPETDPASDFILFTLVGE